MALDILAPRNQAPLNKYVDESLEKINDNTSDSIRPLATLINDDDDDEFHRDIWRILKDALALDKEINRQAARVSWIFYRIPAPFKSAEMELTSRDIQVTEGQMIHLVVAPGLRKRGKSSGEDFETDNQLLEAEVSWVPDQVPRK
ncbi:hypothetical protein ColTof3_05792 [Colletotrichum tofieldiae]|nr:hypothetical protein ColTof3_05792 [Colletotrichum tofieldiae]GKT84532.1 hypothetical protein Ct61P_02382 [Colletotrichum tofieldiae]